ncbi:MAG: hypothetical protein RLZ33_232, partial [Bacteroidota bacterium]
DMSEEKVKHAEIPVQVQKEVETPKLSFEEAKELKRKKNQLNNLVKRVEDAINAHEVLLAKMDEEIALLDYTNEEQSNKLLAEYSKVKAELDQLMMDWEKATEELMELED